MDKFLTDKYLKEKEITRKIIEKCYSEIGLLKNKKEATILGYCVELANRTQILDNGELLCCGYLRNNSEQWEAERIINKVIKEIKV